MCRFERLFLLDKQLAKGQIGRQLGLEQGEQNPEDKEGGAGFADELLDLLRWLRDLVLKPMDLGSRARRRHSQSLLYCPVDSI
jgi:hypothetical protein